MLLRLALDLCGIALIAFITGTVFIEKKKRTKFMKRPCHGLKTKKPPSDGRRLFKKEKHVLCKGKARKKADRGAVKGGKRKGFDVRAQLPAPQPTNR
jgi:hypothetical protein